VSHRGSQNRIRDILDAIAEIQNFREDNKAIRAVEMNFIIVGEAANQIPEKIEEKYTVIP
jgi:uncharacterized protein with HEPN domain